jgi:hypothetical protein
VGESRMEAIKAVKDNQKIEKPKKKHDEIIKNGK